MSRIFPNFLEAYQAYADDSFVPPQFNTWTGLSVIAGALERKVWLPWSPKFSFYPNIYVLLISKPGDGKSVALSKGTDLLQAVNQKTSNLNILPNQITAAKFTELMGNGKTFIERIPERSVEILDINGNPITEILPAHDLIHRQNAGYYFASEASNELTNIYGDFIAALTSLYDCPKTWAKATKKGGKESLHNVCVNLIACSTFDYLGQLVNDSNIQGGFASRLIYVVSKSKDVVAQAWQSGCSNAAAKQERDKYEAALIEDLAHISKIVGPMHATKEFGEAWEAWYLNYERQRRSIESEKLQSLIARTNTNVLKVAMLLSVAESDDLELRIEHWNKALELVLPIYEEVPSLFRQAKASISDPSKINVSSAVIDIVARAPGINKERIIAKLGLKGINKQIVEQMIISLIKEGLLAPDESGNLKATANTNNYL